VEKWRGSTSVEPAAVAATLRVEGKRLPSGLKSEFDAFCNRLDADAVGEHGAP